MGGTLAASTIAGILGGCKSSPGINWIPKAVNADQNSLITIIAELIIPETDTPGAKAAKVNEFIDLMLAEWLSKEEADHFLKGLSDLEERAQNTYQTNFSDCTFINQTLLLEKLEKEAISVSTNREKSNKTKPFFAHIKELTLIGYYTSEIGATQELKYGAMVGRYDGCVPFEEIGKAWSH